MRRQGADRWSVCYRLAQPARALHFEIAYGGYREAHWHAADPALRIVAAGGGVRAERSDGAPFRSACFGLEPRYAEVPANYAPFSPFSDGGVLVFSGMLHACADEPCAGALRWRIGVSAPGSWLLAGGTTARDRARFDSVGEGVLVYAGPTRPATRVHAVIDPGLPLALRQQLDALLPLLLKRFSADFGALSRAPTLFASLDRYPRSGAGLSYQGGVLPGQVFLHFYGPDWHRPAAAAQADFIPAFFAHELAHFFHGERAGGAAVNDDQAWIHEGGAEAFALLAVRALGDAGYADRRTARAVPACADGLSRLAKPLNDAARAGAFGLAYDCGLLLQLAVDADVRRATAGTDTLAGVWRDFLDSVRAGAPWTDTTYLAAARRHGLTPETEALVTELTTQAQTLNTDALLQRLADAGLDVPPR